MTTDDLAQDEDDSAVRAVPRLRADAEPDGADLALAKAVGPGERALRQLAEDGII